MMNVFLNFFVKKKVYYSKIIELFPKLLYNKEEIIDNIRYILKITDKILTNFDIIYWADGGTLIGTFRNKDVIQWDKDGDICILEKDIKNLLSLQREFKKYHCSIVQRYYGVYRIVYNKGNNYVFVDILACNKKDKCYYYCNPVTKIMFKKSYFPSEQLFPLKREPFNNFSLSCPNDSKSYLDRVYGKDWKDVGYIYCKGFKIKINL